MRIACLQFAPQLGDIDNNLNRADAVLSRANPKDIDLLVLPELAFSGYNFKSLKDITPYLEPTASGITSLWARTTALKYDCVVTVGYPEKVDVTEKWPASPEYYNSAITVNADGETIANYRKSFLYYCDETWALEGPDGFYDGMIPGLGNVVMGICMDLNPYKFEAPWSAWEFAYHILHKQANLVVLTMAWLTRQDAGEYSRNSRDPDMETLSYWLARLEPVIRAEDIGEIIIVLANRCGVEDDAVYAGTSCVLGIDKGEVKLYGILGRGEKELLVIDTDDEPKAKLVADASTAIPENSAQPRMGPNLDPEPYARDTVVPSIEAVLSAGAPVSPVETRNARAYYNPQPPKREEVLETLKSSIPSESCSSSSSIPSPAISPNTPLSAGSMIRPQSARSQRPRRMEEQQDIVISKKMMESLEIVSVVDLKKDSKEPSSACSEEPYSASSMTTNTPWDANPSYFRAEDLFDIIVSSTPVMNGNVRYESSKFSTPLTNGSVRYDSAKSSTPATNGSIRHESPKSYTPVMNGNVRTPKSSTPVTPVMNGDIRYDSPKSSTPFMNGYIRYDSPQTSTPLTNGYIRYGSPSNSSKHSSQSSTTSSKHSLRSTKSRNKSRSRVPPPEHTIVGLGVDINYKPDIASVVIPAWKGPEQISPSRRYPLGSNLLTPEERGLSPRPKSTGW